MSLNYKETQILHAWFKPKNTRGACHDTPDTNEARGMKKSRSFVDSRRSAIHIAISHLKWNRLSFPCLSPDAFVVKSRIGVISLTSWQNNANYKPRAGL
jgi:hypothetical protein